MTDIFIIDDETLHTPGDRRGKILPSCDDDKYYPEPGGLYDFLHEKKLYGSKNVCNFPHIVLIHINNGENKELRDFNGLFTKVKEEIHNKSNDWGDGVVLLAYSVKKICAAGGRVILFTGGLQEEFDEYSDVIVSINQLLESNEMQPSYKYFVPTSCSYINKYKAEYDSVTIDKNWHINSLIKGEENNSLFVFHALDILIQGYLIINASGTISDKNYENIEPITIQDQTYAEGATIKKRLFRPHSFKDSKDCYWFDECLTDVSANSWNKLCLENRSLVKKNPVSLQKVWNHLRNICCDKKDVKKLENNLDLIELFKKVHSEYLDLIMGS
jgi:hypothetical protein